MSRWCSERGAAAVEFALVVPLLLALLLGIIEFGHVYNAQISLTHAARETARSMVIKEVWADAVAAGRAAAPSLDRSSMAFSAVPSTCPAGSMIEVTITYPLKTITGIADDIVLEGKAAMRCGG